MTGLEKLLQRKLPADTFKAVMEALDPEDLDVIPRSRLNEVIDERDTVKADLAKLQKAGGADNANELTKKLTALQTKYDTDIKSKDAEITGIRRDHQIETKLTAAKARNLTAVKALLDQTKIGDDLKGLDEEITRVQKSDAYLFDTTSGAPAGTGKEHAGDSGAPGGNGSGASGNGAPTDAMYNAVFGGMF